MSKHYFDEELDFLEVDDFSDNSDVETEQSEKSNNTDMPSAAKSYIDAINAKCPQRLSPQESIELGRIMKTGSEKEAQDARTKLVEGHLVFALKYVLRAPKNKHCALEDLIQAANMGLMRAVDHYDYSRGVAFTTYCVPYLTEEITSQIANVYRTIPLSKHYKRQLSRVARYLQQHPEHTNDHKAIAEALGISEAMVTKFINLDAASIPFGYDEAADDSDSTMVYRDNHHAANFDDGYDIGGLTDSQTEPSPDEYYAIKDRNERLKALLDTCVNKLEKTVILLRTGIETEYNGQVLPVTKQDIPTFETIGSVVGCGKTRAWQAFNSGLNKIRAVANPEDFL